MGFVNKVLSIFVIVVFIFSNVCFAYEAPASNLIKADITSKRIPAGRVLKIKFYDKVSTSIAKQGDLFNAVITEDQMVDNNIILPAGTIIRGTVSKITPSRLVSRGAELYVTFDHIVTPTGRQVAIGAGLCNLSNLSINGGITTGRNYFTEVHDDYSDCVLRTKKATAWGKDLGSKFWNGYPKYAIAPVSGISGGVFNGVIFVGNIIGNLCRKGSDVTIDQENAYSVILTQPLDIPVN